jgi:hypothetical protein
LGASRSRSQPAANTFAPPATDANGNAACSGVLTGVAQSVLALGYQASFTGDVAHQPASENGRLSIAAGTKLP